MVRLSDAGWSVPKIARQFGEHEQTPRAWIKPFLAEGFDAVTDKPRGGDHAAVTPAMLESVRTEIAKGDRTWSARELAEWVAEQHGVRIGPGRMRVHLQRAKRSSQRTARSLRHKQQAEEVDKGTAQLAAREQKAMLG
jgi:transposase